MIQAIYREEKQWKDLPAKERKDSRRPGVKPLVEAYFTWVRENLLKVPQKSKTWEGFQYSINQEKYLKVNKYERIRCLLLEVFSHIFLQNSRYVLSTVYPYFQYQRKYVSFIIK